MSVPAGVLVVGDLGVDVLVTPSRAPEHGSDVPARIRTVAGGAGANTAAWLAHLGAAVTLLARVGDDPPGRQALAEVRAAGVHPLVTVDPEAPTCTVVVLLDAPPAREPDSRSEQPHPLAGGARTMFSDRGAAARLAPADVAGPPAAGVSHLHLSGYVLADPGSRLAGLAALRGARAAGLSTSVDPQSAHGIADPAAFRSWVRGVDLLLPNSDELRGLTGSADPASATDLLDDVGAVVVTAGAAGASWWEATGSTHAGATRAGALDPTGAGDAFDAGLLVAWLSGAGPAAALRAGCDAGARAVAGWGGRPVSSR